MCPMLPTEKMAKNKKPNRWNEFGDELIRKLFAGELTGEEAQALIESANPTNNPNPDMLHTGRRDEVCRMKRLLLDDPRIRDSDWPGWVRKSMFKMVENHPDDCTVFNHLVNDASTQELNASTHEKAMPFKQQEMNDRWHQPDNQPLLGFFYRLKIPTQAHQAIDARKTKNNSKVFPVEPEDIARWDTQLSPYLTWTSQQLEDLPATTAKEIAYRTKVLAGFALAIRFYTGLRMACVKYGGEPSICEDKPRHIGMSFVSKQKDKHPVTRPCLHHDRQLIIDAIQTLRTFLPDFEEDEPKPTTADNKAFKTIFDVEGATPHKFVRGLYATRVFESPATYGYNPGIEKHILFPMILNHESDSAWMPYACVTIVDKSGYTIPRKVVPDQKTQSSPKRDMSVMDPAPAPKRAKTVGEIPARQRLVLHLVE